MFSALFKFVFIAIALTFVCYLVLFKFVILGFASNKHLLALVLLVTQVISLIFATGNIIKVLFQNRDNELLMTMPVSPNQVFVSKVILSYIQELIINTTITLPLLISIAILGKFSIYFYCMLPIVLILLPILPTALALLISIPVSHIINFFKRHTISSTILILAAVVTCVVLYSKLLSNFAESFNIVSKQIETIITINNALIKFSKINVFFSLFVDAILSITKIYYLLIYVFTCAIIMGLAVLAVRPFFFKVAMSNLENFKGVYKEGRFKSRSKFRSLLYNEFINVFRSPGIIFEYFLFTILMPFVVVVYDNLLLGLVVNQSGSLMINGAHLLIVGIFCTLSNIYSASAISREGVNFYLIKTAPVDYYTQTFAKVAFNAMFSVGSIIITGIVSCFYLNIWVVIFTTIICIFLSLGHIFYCFDNEIKQPTLDWYDSGEISKISKNTTKAIVASILIALVSGVVVMTLSTKIGLWSFAIMLIISIAYCLYMLYVLILRVSYKYETLEP